MITRFTIALLLLGLVGCKKPVANAPPPPPEVTASEVTQPAEVIPSEDTAEDAVSPAEATGESADALEHQAEETAGSTAEESAATEQSPGEAEAEAEADPESEPVGGENAEAVIAEENKLPRERFLLLTRDGPLVIDVVMTIDGESYAQALESVLDGAFAEADSDGDGEATWEEMLANPKFAYGQFGNLVPEDEGERARLIQMYDNNRNDLVERDELPRFLTRNAGGSRAFSLQSSNEFHGENRSRSPIRRLLDQDRDGAITATELDDAPMRLFNRDSDDDEILVLADFKDTVQPMQTQMPNRRRINAPDTAILLGERTRWNNVVYALQETYAYGNRVGADDVPLTPSLVKQLDENENEVIDTKEVPRLTEVAPHLEFEVTFFNKAAGAEASPKIRLLSVCDELRSIVDAALKHPTRLSMQLPGAEVEFFVNDDASLLNTSQVVQNQFNMLDADNNDYIDEDEYSGQFLGFNISFEAADADGNGMIFEEEVLAFVEIRQSVMRSQIRARAADQEDALFTFLDSNGDGRLTAREIYGAPQALRSLDRNQDERVQSQEIPGTIAVGFVRGNAQNNNNLFAAPALPVANREAPSWFRGMDTNGDGDISPREFLGAREKFLELDQDADGFIGLDEIASLVDESKEAD